ncbi:MAG: HupE/UreJ family protein, partial [Anaerolineales bacterium]|nr:HupE/UreJ family protein [Anaerolineales bacterium]
RNGQVFSQHLGPQQSRWRVPAEETITGVASQYTVLGIEHILSGYDHLLFLACLLFIAGGLRNIVITITGFTLAHSITLAAAALQWLYLPVPAVEASIALSIIFLARELVLNNRQTLSWRRPVLVSISFGLLHGFGFAAVLTEIGLPQTEVPAALLFFNLGVELGQLLFVMVAAFIFILLTRLVKVVKRQHQGLQLTCGYGVGILACFWLCERTAEFV